MALLWNEGDKEFVDHGMMKEGKFDSKELGEVKL